MATKNGVSVEKRGRYRDEEAEVSDVEAISTVVEPDDDVDIKKIDDILKSNDLDDGMVRISRRGPEDRDFQYVNKIASSEFDIDYVRKIYGGGDYKCQTFRANGQMYKGFKFSIDHRYKGSLDVAPAGDGGASTKIAMEMVRQATSEGKRNTDMMLKVQEISAGKGDQMLTLLITSMNNSQQQMMQLMCENQKNMVGMMAALNRPTGSDSATLFIPILLEMIKARGSMNPLDDMQKLMGIVSLMKSGKVDGDEEEPKPMWMELLSSVAAKAIPALIPSNQTPAPQLPAPSVQAQPVQEDELTRIKELVIGAAIRGNDPSAYASMILDNIPDAEYNQLEAILTRDDWHVLVFRNDPRVQSVLPWMSELKENLLNAINGDNTESDNVPPRIEERPAAVRVSKKKGDSRSARTGTDSKEV